MKTNGLGFFDFHAELDFAVLEEAWIPVKELKRSFK
jgi:hypothetical protein